MLRDYIINNINNNMIDNNIFVYFGGEFEQTFTVKIFRKYQCLQDCALVARKDLAYYFLASIAVIPEQRKSGH